jgi:ketosteroid isomerase-like protein
LSAFDDSIEWTINGESIELLMRLGEKSTKVETKRFRADGDVVVVLTKVTVGAAIADEADVFEFRDGKIIKTHSSGDTAMQERVFGSKRVTAEPQLADFDVRTA